MLSCRRLRPRHAGARGVGSEGKSGLRYDQTGQVLFLDHTGLPQRNGFRSAIFFFFLVFVSDLPEQIHGAAQSGPTALRGQGCVIQSRPRIASAAPLKARSNLVSKDLVGGLWCPRQVWWMVCGIAHLNQNVFCCAAVLCSACARALSRLQSQVAVAVAGEEGRGLRLEARPESFCPTSRARAFFLLPRSEWLGCRYRQPTAHIHTHTTITGTQTHTDRSEQDL